MTTLGRDVQFGEQSVTIKDGNPRLLAILTGGDQVDEITIKFPKTEKLDMISLEWTKPNVSDEEPVGMAMTIFKKRFVKMIISAYVTSMGGKFRVDGSSDIDIDGGFVPLGSDTIGRIGLPGTNMGFPPWYSPQQPQAMYPPQYPPMPMGGNGLPQDLMVWYNNEWVPNPRYRGMFPNLFPPQRVG
jgi:hypothetical protein